MGWLNGCETSYEFDITYETELTVLQKKLADDAVDKIKTARRGGVLAVNIGDGTIIECYVLRTSRPREGSDQVVVMWMESEEGSPYILGAYVVD